MLPFSSAIVLPRAKYAGVAVVHLLLSSDIVFPRAKYAGDVLFNFDLEIFMNPETNNLYFFSTLA